MERLLLKLFCKKYPRSIKYFYLLDIHIQVCILRYWTLVKMSERKTLYRINHVVVLMMWFLNQAAVHLMKQGLKVSQVSKKQPHCVHLTKPRADHFNKPFCAFIVFVFLPVKGRHHHSIMLLPPCPIMDMVCSVLTSLIYTLAMFNYLNCN